LEVLGMRRGLNEARSSLSLASPVYLLLHQIFAESTYIMILCYF
jgi:hypothetical protein